LKPILQQEVCMMARALGLLALLFGGLLLGVPSLGAQIEAGARVRVTTQPASPGRRIGSLVSLDGDSLRYSRWDTTSVIALPLTSVDRLERSIGRRSNTGRGAMIGGLIGAGFGLFLGVAASTDNSGWWEVGVDDIAVATAIVGAGGAGVGALIGSLSKRDRWEPVPLRKTVTGLTLRF
jgi:hypothetical protein